MILYVVAFEAHCNFDKNNVWKFNLILVFF